MASGILYVDKPAGLTSRALDNAVQKLFHTKKVGHLGTLDPFATGLLIVAILPQLLSGAFEIPWAISSFFGGTSLLIIVGVALDTLRIMESHLLVRKYDGFLRHGTLRGRGGV